jgi:hypothetical protein
VLIPGNLSILRGLRNAVSLYMLQIGALPKSRAPETKKRQSGDWRSRAKSKVLPSKHSTLICIFCQGVNPAKNGKAKPLCSPVRSVLELERYDSLELGRLAADRNEGRATPKAPTKGRCALNKKPQAVVAKIPTMTGS